MKYTPTSLQHLIVLFSIFWLFLSCHTKDFRWTKDFQLFDDSLWYKALSKQINKHDSMYPLDSTVSHFMIKHHVPGLSLAVAKDGRLLYSKGYGLADLSTGQEVTNKSLFRIAQISMNITAIAIMKLVEEHKLSFDSKVFGDSGVLGTQLGHKPYTRYITDITIGHLLSHSSGGWSGQDDPLFQPKFRDTFFSKNVLLSWTIDNIPLKSKPGSSFAFSYFGYFILGRVIEKVSGLKYDDYVKENIFKPLGITDMEIEVEGEKRRNEVSFYKDLTWPSYNGVADDDLFINRADATIGWIAAPTDLVKLLTKVNESGFKKDSSDKIIERYNLDYAKVNPEFIAVWCLQDTGKSWGCTWDFFATSLQVVKSDKGFCVAILVNTYRPIEKDYFPDMHQIVRKITDDSTISWPENVPLLKDSELRNNVLFRK